jgi:two-component system chemotaxis response regulator CheY
MDKNKMSILIVEDFATMRRIMRSILREAGYPHVMEADDGMSALRKLRGERIDLVIADWNMPNMTGLDLLKVMRSDEALRGIPFLMVTAEGKKDNIIEAIQSGASSYLVKPFTPESFSQKIQEILVQEG